MPTFSQAQLAIMPTLVAARIDIVKEWFFAETKPGEVTLFAKTLKTIQDSLTPIYDPDPTSVHRCVGSVLYDLTQAIKQHNATLPRQTNVIFIAQLTKLAALENLDILYASLKAMTSANPAFAEIEKLQLDEEKTELFKGFKHNYIGPEDRGITSTEEKSQFRL